MGGANSTPIDSVIPPEWYSLPRHHGVVEPVVGEALVALDARVAERGVFVAAEGEHGLVHLLGVEHLQAHEQVEVLHRQPGDGQEQVRLQLGDDVLQRVLAEVGQVHERRDARGELDQLLLDQLALGLVLLLLVGELLLLLRRQVARPWPCS